MKRLQGFLESFVEVLVIIKVCLTTFWFWLPPLFAAYFYLQLWMIFFVHPITILLVPAVVALFSMFLEERRVRIQYGLEEVKVLRASDPIGAMPRSEKSRWNVEKAVREFEESLKSEEKKKEDG